MAIDLIYKMTRTQSYDVDDTDFFFVDSLHSAVVRLPLLWRDRGWFGTAKVVVKVVLGRCCYFGLAQGDRLLTSGVLALGYCRFYPVEPDAVVIGEMVTAPASRGRGHGTRAIMLAINAMLTKGATTFYIDTQRGNIAMIRSIAKLGFGDPIGGEAAGEYS